MLAKFALMLIVKPSGYSTRGQLFDGFVDGRLVVSRTTQPLLDACRVLLGEGVDPATRMVLRHAGQDYDALRSTVGAAARLTIEEGERPPTFRRWKPSPHAAVTPSVRQTEEAATCE